MGLFDFVKDAGARLFGRDEKPPEPTEAPEVIAARKASALTRIVNSIGIAVDGLSISVNDDTAVIRGRVSSQAEKEKVVLTAGNVNGISRVDDQLEVEAPEPEATFYTVKSGDSLSKIAKEHYGNAMKYPMIFEANKPMLSDPDKIYPGQVLRIPPQAN